ncbi:6-carboxytetrahydropterin synthase [Solidesulfovibrio sp.]|jgi:6-pyruvoyltetrahydropterin/6-carboxytetrahydropterin synthase|uniref:6-pyruvoyl trahydropterin synthase family protein n=1 Tax=Solidesulfovibrio sp. TaxID=2910990 RepID=UPI000ED8A082|nr:6-carboxytetrahydropterin synthase [Solidesulfovibrio sp.]MEA5090636.1 6-carboxytetrahydropterin synthase [Solidesulfovibrio sp.]HCR14347.1 6-carboxytetrahydropterin synthase [Desulfovibrio sp.]HML61192.1 6-carboxytetrahydropterin synthase [Solidesulfovibrio sp.]
MAATYTIKVSGAFSAAHRLPGHPGPCASMHGHNFEVTAELAAQTLVSGMVADFMDVRAALDACFARLDHACLNDVPELSPPTAEVIAAWIFGELRARLEDGRVRVAKVSVVESEGLAASYAETP